VVTANKELWTLRGIAKVLQEDPNIAVLLQREGKAVRVPLWWDELSAPILAIVFEGAVFAASGSERRVFAYESG
jgi:hypothetical protein